MALDSKIEAVKKVSEALNKQPVSTPEDLERVAPNKEHFQSLMDQTRANPIEAQRNASTMITNESVSPLENNTIFTDQNFSSQQTGSATDQDQNRKRKHPEDDDSVQGVGGSGFARKEKKVSSLMDEVGKLNSQASNLSKLSPEGLKNQSTKLIAQIEEVKAQLAQANSEIKPSYQALLKNRLTHADDNLRMALSKAGVEYTPPAPELSSKSGGSPMDRFIGFLTHSQYQLEHLGDSVEKLASSKNFSPATMLTIQIKVGYVQQQIELFTSLLNKALESTKTIMNVQV